MHFEGSYDKVGRARTMVGLEAAAGLVVVSLVMVRSWLVGGDGRWYDMPFLLFFYNPAILGNARHYLALMPRSA
jgi:hypothetical protein